VQIIGLTGGIATGKSAVSAILSEAGAFIIDADRIARAVVKKGLPAYREIVAQFGTEVLLPDVRSTATCWETLFLMITKKSSCSTASFTRMLIKK
jgi:dephospho-CoA kinase